MAYFPPTGSTVSFQSDPANLHASITGTVTVRNPQSVSGTVGASIIGLVPVMVNNELTGQVLGRVYLVDPTNTNRADVASDGAVMGSVHGAVSVAGGSLSVANFPTTQNISGSVAVWLQSTNASVITVGSPVANQSISGTVQTDVRGSVAVVIIGGSVAVATGNSSVQVLNFPTNQSVSGAVSISNLPTTQNVSGSVVAFQGTPEWTVKSSLTGGIFPISGSVAVGNFPTNQNVSGSVVAFQSGTRITSLVSTIPSSVIVGSSIFGQLPGGTAVLGSVAALQGTNPWTMVTPAGSVTAVSGISFSLSSVVVVAGSIISVPVGSTITVLQSSSIRTISNVGTNITSIVNIVPSSVIVGTSIFGQLPGGTAVLGSIATLQGTNPWVVNFQNSSIIAINAGSVVTITPGSVITVFQAPSIVGTYAEDAVHTTADKGIFVLAVRNDAVQSFAAANLEYSPMSTDSAGRSVIKPFAPGEASQIGTASTVNFGTTTAASIRLFTAPGAGLKNYITDYNISNTGATTTLVSFVDEDASVMGRTIAPAGGGSNHSFAIPLTTQITNKQVGVIAANATSVLHITLTGFKAP